MTSIAHPSQHLSGLPAVRLVLISWLGMVGVDLFLHAGLLAPLYSWDSPFLLTPEQAFVRIPVGYLAFLFLAGALAWALPRFGVRNGREGALGGAASGAAIWGALVLGLWSISTADPALLVAWWAGQWIELAVAGYFIGASLAGTRLRTLALQAGAVLVVSVLVAIILQSIGYAPVQVINPN